MLKIIEDDAHRCFLLEPAGKLTRQDFERLNEQFNAREGASGNIPNLVIHSRDFPGWTNFGALIEHLKFVHDHQKTIDKIALVSDARILDIVQHVARHFLAAQIRHFPATELTAALEWVAAPDSYPSHVGLIEGLPDDVIGISVHGVVTARDYAETIVPLIEGKLRDHKRLEAALPDQP